MSSSSQAVLPPGPVMVDVQGMVLTDQERERLRHPLLRGQTRRGSLAHERAELRIHHFADRGYPGQSAKPRDIVALRLEDGTNDIAARL